MKRILFILFIIPLIGFGQQSIVSYYSSSSWSYSGSGTSSSNFTGNSTNHSNYSTGYIKFQVVNAGTIYINSTVSSESNYDYARVIVNGSQVWYQSGTASFGWHSYSVSPGQIIEFRYTKDGSVSNYNDEQTFQLYSNNNSPSSINSISPNNGNQGQTLSVSISGTNMNYGSQWSGTLSDFRFSQWSGSNMFYGNPTSTSGNYLYGSVSISSGQNTGWYDLEVYDQNTGNWVQKNSAFYVNYSAPVAQINSISPNSGDQGQTLSVSISGTNMNYGSQWSGTLSDFRFSQWSGSNMFYGNPTSTSGNYLYGDVSIPSGQNTGWYDLEVWDHNSASWIQKNNAFEVFNTPSGCTDSTAYNYDPNATLDDGSCCYDANGCTCEQIITGNFENGYAINYSGYMTATDLTVNSNEDFILTKFTPSIWLGGGGTIYSMTINYYSDNGGLPGNFIGTPQESIIAICNTLATI